VSAPGSVLANLRAMRGVWHDRLTATDPAGMPLTSDPHGGTPGPLPYENLVYVDVDDDGRFAQTNVVLRGREPHVRSFTGSVRDGVLVFDALGPEDPGHVGVSGGAGVLVFLPRRLDAPSLRRFSDPDVITFDARSRTRVTTLYRQAELVRVLTVAGYRVADDPSRRVPWDPRGPEGPVHEERSATRVYVQD
jgi:hypothetical protein